MVTFPDSLTSLLEPIEAIHPHEDNPNMGDVEAIMESIKVNGCYRPIIAQRGTGRILAGNHTWQALHGLGATHAPVVWVDKDDSGSLRILLSDNRIASLGRVDDRLVANLLEQLCEEPQSLIGTGYESDDYARLLNRLQEDEERTLGDILKADPVLNRRATVTVVGFMSEEGEVQPLTVGDVSDVILRLADLGYKAVGTTK